MFDGTLLEQELDTTHDSILAALGRPIPEPAEPAAPAVQPKNPRRPERSDTTMPPIPEHNPDGGKPDGGHRESGPDNERKASLIRNGRVQGLTGLGVAAGFAIGLLISGKPWHLPPAWGDIPTWISAIATIGLLADAIITARYAIKAFRAQSEQLTDQRKIN
jgi:hypothetical protein